MSMNNAGQGRSVIMDPSRFLMSDDLALAS
jgi:hypothetical protein